MPVYEYQCSACQFEFEREQRISEDPVKKCPKCGKQKAKRLISRTSFVLKGGGWYGDLYASQKPSGEKKDDAASAASAKADTTQSEGAAAPTESKSDAAKSDGKSEKKGGKKKAAAA